MGLGNQYLLKYFITSMELEVSWYIYKLRSGILFIEPVIKGYNWGIPCPDQFKNLLYSFFPSSKHRGYIYGYRNYYKRYSRTKLEYRFGICTAYSKFSTFNIKESLSPRIDDTINNLISDTQGSVSVVLSPIRNFLNPDKVIKLVVDPDTYDEVDFISKVREDIYLNISTIGIADFNLNLLDEILFRNWVDRYMGSNNKLFYDTLEEFTASSWSTDELDKINTLGEVFLRL